MKDPLLKKLFESYKIMMNESGITSDELQQKFPDWGTKKQKTGGHKTQRSNTDATYMKIVNWIGSLENKKVLDLSAGMGHGIQILRSTGADVESSEPFPPEGFSPTYGYSSEVPSNTYDFIVNSVVLNVVPIDIRTEIVRDIGRALKPEGIAVITARQYEDVIRAAKTPINTVIDSELGEVYIANSTDFQKGFRPRELKNYVQNVLGSDFEVRNKNEVGLMVSPEAVVVKKIK